MLTATEAFALLERHCAALRGSQWANVDFDRNREWHDAVRELVDLVVVAPAATSTAQARELGAWLRLALAVTQAVSHCRGFAPETNPAFWRHAIHALWLPRPRKWMLELFVLSRKTFDYVGIQWGLDSSADDTFWIGFFYGTPACDAALTAVRHALRQHADPTAPVPPLRVALSNCRAYSSVDAWCPPDTNPLIPVGIPHHHYVSPTADAHAVWSMVRAALRSPVATTWTEAAGTHLGLVVDFRVGFGVAVMRDTLALLAWPVPHAHLQLSIDRLVIELTPHEPPRAAEPGACSRHALVSRGRPLGELLRGLLLPAARSHTPRVRTVALTGSSHGDYRLVGAVLSGVARASPPLAELRCRHLLDASIPRDNMLRLAWLVFALHVARPAPPALALLSTSVAIDDREREYMRALLARGTPLRDVVGEALRLRLGGDDDRVARLQVRCLRLGSTAQLARGTPLTFEPFHDGNDDDAVAAITPSAGPEEDEPLDLVAHVTAPAADRSSGGEGGVVGVVYAGYGLVWAPAACVVTCRVLDEEDGVAGHSEDARLPSALALRFEGDGARVREGTFRATALLPLVADATLSKLALDRVILTRDDLAFIVDSFPRLSALRLDRCVVESLEPLVAAYARPPTQRPRLTTLSLVGVRDLRFRGRWEKSSLLPDRCLTSHSVDGDAPSWLAAFVDALAGGRLGDPTGLRELRVDVCAFGSVDAERGLLEQLARALACDGGAMRSLTRLHVTHRYHGLVDAPLELFGPLRDVTVRDPPRVRCAALSVLRVFGCGASDVARAVLALAEGGAVRTITWVARG